MFRTIWGQRVPNVPHVPNVPNTNIVPGQHRHGSVQLMFAIPSSVVAPVVRGAHNFLDSAGPGLGWTLGRPWANFGPASDRPWAIWANLGPTLGRPWAQALADLGSTFGRLLVDFLSTFG